MPNPEKPQGVQAGFAEQIKAGTAALERIEQFVRQSGNADAIQAWDNEVYNNPRNPSRSLEGYFKEFFLDQVNARTPGEIDAAVRMLHEAAQKPNVPLETATQFFKGDVGQVIRGNTLIALNLARGDNRGQPEQEQNGETRGQGNGLREPTPAAKTPTPQEAARDTLRQLGFERQVGIKDNRPVEYYRLPKGEGVPAAVEALKALGFQEKAEFLVNADGSLRIRSDAVPKFENARSREQTAGQARASQGVRASAPLAEPMGQSQGGQGAVAGPAGPAQEDVRAPALADRIKKALDGKGLKYDGSLNDPAALLDNALEQNRGQDVGNAVAPLSKEISEAAGIREGVKTRVAAAIRLADTPPSAAIAEQKGKPPEAPPAEPEKPGVVRRGAAESQAKPGTGENPPAHSVGQGNPVPEVAQKGQPIELKPGMRINLGGAPGSPSLTVVSAEGTKIKVVVEEYIRTPSGKEYPVPVARKELDLSKPTRVGREAPAEGIKVSDNSFSRSVSRSHGVLTTDGTGQPVYINTATNPDRIDVISPEKVRKLQMTPAQRAAEMQKQEESQRQQEEAVRAAEAEKESARRAALTPEERRIEDIRNRMAELDAQKHWAAPSLDAAMEREKKINKEATALKAELKELEKGGASRGQAGHHANEPDKAPDAAPQRKPVPGNRDLTEADGKPGRPRADQERHLTGSRQDRSANASNGPRPLTPDERAAMTRMMAEDAAKKATASPAGNSPSAPAGRTCPVETGTTPGTSSPPPPAPAAVTEADHVSTATPAGPAAKQAKGTVPITEAPAGGSVPTTAETNPGLPKPGKPGTTPTVEVRQEPAVGKAGGRTGPIVESTPTPRPSGVTLEGGVEVGGSAAMAGVSGYGFVKSAQAHDTGGMVVNGVGFTAGSVGTAAQVAKIAGATGKAAKVLEVAAPVAEKANVLLIPIEAGIAAYNEQGTDAHDKAKFKAARADAVLLGGTAGLTTGAALSGGLVIEGVAATGAVAAAGTAAAVAAPLAAAVVVGWAADQYVEVAKQYAEEDKRFAAQLEGSQAFQHITSAANSSKIQARVQKLAQAEGLNFNDQADKAKQPLLDRTGHIDFSHPEAARLLHQAIRQEIAEQDKTINDLGRYLPRYNPFSNAKTMDTYNLALSDKAALTAARDELEQGYVPIAKERADKRHEHDQKLDKMDADFRQESEVLAKKAEAAALDARDLTLTATSLAEKAKQLTGKEPEPVYLLQEAKTADGKPKLNENGQPVLEPVRDKDGNPVLAAKRLEEMDAAIKAKEQEAVGLTDEQSRRAEEQFKRGRRSDDPAYFDPAAKAREAAAWKDLQQMKLDKEKLASWTAGQGIVQSARTIDDYRRETLAMLDKEKGLNRKEVEEAATHDPTIQKAAERYNELAKANAEQPSAYKAEKLVSAQIELIQAEREFYERQIQQAREKDKHLAKTAAASGKEKDQAPQSPQQGTSNGKGMAVGGNAQLAAANDPAINQAPAQPKVVEGPAVHVDDGARVAAQSVGGTGQSRAAQAAHK